MIATKIVATLGPATDGILPELLAAGVDVCRINFSHGDHAEHGRRIREVREAARALDRFVAIMGDLQGPKIRISGFTGGSVVLVPGRTFTIDLSLAADAGTETAVGSSYGSLADEVLPGDVLVLGDGLIELQVEEVAARRIACKVQTGGELGGYKGINKRGGGLSAPALTDKDRVDLRFACEQELDYVAVSFPRSAADIQLARELLAGMGGQCGIVAKIERAEAVADPETLDALILAADAVMVARGDLGIEIGDAALMGVQKNIIARARALNRSVITATQMMESMIEHPRPTRAEVMDVANSVVDGTDAVMFSGETAVGQYPVQTVATAARVIGGAEASAHFEDQPVPEGTVERIDEAIAHSAMTVAARLRRVKAVCCFTASGNTPRLMSRIASRLPIYAMADNVRTLARVALFRGVHPVFFPSDQVDVDQVNDAVVSWLRDHGVVTGGDRVILSKGDYRNVQGGTNALKIMEVR